MESALTKACTLKLDNFEGPFDLLFHLIEKNQVDIYDIPINTITDQYLDYLYAMQQLDLEVASEFLVMASTLLHIKSKMLLPDKKEQKEEVLDPREELVKRLIEYKRYKEFAKELKELEKSGILLFTDCLKNLISRSERKYWRLIRRYLENSIWPCVTEIKKR